MDMIPELAKWMNVPNFEICSPINITGLKFVTAHSYTIIVTDGDWKLLKGWDVENSRCISEF